MSEAPPQPAETYLQLRIRIFGLTPEDVGITPSEEAPQVWGVVMEAGYEAGSATLVSLADGTTSLYYSTGGGMLGRGDYTPISEASRALVAQAEIDLPRFSKAVDYPLPEVGQVHCPDLFRFVHCISRHHGPS